VISVENERNEAEFLHQMGSTTNNWTGFPSRDMLWNTLAYLN